MLDAGLVFSALLVSFEFSFIKISPEFAFSKCENFLDTSKYSANDGIPRSFGCERKLDCRLDSSREISPEDLSGAASGRNTLRETKRSDRRFLGLVAKYTCKVFGPAGLYGAEILR